jgi:CHAT domain-containing protein
MKYHFKPSFQIWLIIGFIAIAPLTLSAQNWNKYYDKSDAAYVPGDYAKASKFIEKAIKKSTKKLGAENAVLANALMRQARIDIALGVYVGVPEKIARSLEMAEKVSPDDKSSLAYLYKDATSIHIEYGNYVLAEEALGQAKELFATGDITDEIVSQLTLLEAQILAGKGYSTKSIALSDTQLTSLQPKLASAGKESGGVYEKLYASFLVEKANALRKMGDFQAADSAFISNERWMDNNLDKGDLLLVRNKYLNAKLLQENGLSREAEAKLFEDAYKTGSRKFLPTHKDLIAVNQDLMNAYFATNQGGKLRILENDFTKLLTGLPANSIYNYSKDLQQAYYYVEDENFAVVESRIIRILSKPSFPTNHPIRIELYEYANNVALLYGQHKNTAAYQNEILKIKSALYGKTSPEYHLTNIRLANYYIDFEDRFEEVKEIYETSFNKIIDPEITDGHIMYLDILNHLAKYYEETDQYTLAGSTLNRALYVARKKYDNRDLSYGNALTKIASLSIRIGKYEDAEAYLEEAFSIFDDVKSDLSISYQAIAMITKAKLLEIEGEYDEAEESLFKADQLREEGKLIMETSTIDYQDDLAGLYIEAERLVEAAEILRLSIISKSRDFGKESRKLNQAFILSSKLNLLKGDYAEAENFASRANDIMSGIFGETSSKVVPSMLALARVYQSLGDYEKAETQLQKSLVYQRREFGEDHVDVGKTLSELALVKFYQKAPLSETTALFQQAEQIIGKKLGQENPTYAQVLKNLAIANIAAGDYEVAIDNLDQADKIWSKKIGKRNSLNSASVDILKGDIAYRQSDFNKADNRYKDALAKYEKFFSDTHPEFVKIQSKLAKTYFMSGDWRKALNQIDGVLAKYKDFIRQYFPTLSEREKAKYWNTIKPDYEFFNTLIVSKNRNEKYIGELYNNALLTKALLLSSSIKIRRKIMGSNDTELQNTYREWIAKKELLTTALSMTREQLAVNNIDQSKLASDLESLEKELSLKSEAFGETYEKKPITWENVQESLNENEVAIEMVRFRVFEKDFSDSVKYALLYITGQKRAKPQMILLDNGQELESKYLKYYRNSIRFQIKDTRSYEAYWKPIVDEIGPVATIYLSPDGVYNQINLEAIPIPGSNKYVLDNSNITLISNTKDLYLKKQELKKEPKTTQLVAAIFGDPVFYIETSKGIPTKNSGLSRESAVQVSQLPGTKKEIDQVENYLDRNGYEVQNFSSLDAREEIVKLMASPNIFHVATHGFFQEETVTASVTDQSLYEDYLYENPLLKSGLLLSGAGDILNTTKYNFNINDGILTAYEAMNLNLDQTELVVLSACETGLGELEAGEGVYGLQRSFLVAGAQAVIMSLFKVSDEVTQQLMVRFYQKWLETGDKRQAFIDAKKEIRNEYPDPIYWGPFVMIGSN